MELCNGQSIYFVDDEEGIRKVTSSTLSSVGYNVRCFSNGHECLNVLGSENCNLLITDVKMPGMDGLTLLEKSREITPWVPVLIITGYADIAMAVRAMKSGAADFIEKPFEREGFLKKIRSILDRETFNDCAVGDNLTRSEMKILKMILDGHSNKEMAAATKRSVRTIEMHRSHIMQKFGVSNIVDLVKRTSQMELEDE